MKNISFTLDNTTAMSWIGLFNNTLSMTNTTKITIILQENNSERRAIIKTTSGIFDNSLYGNKKVLSDELNTIYTMGEEKSNILVSSIERMSSADVWIRRYFSTLPYRLDKQYDMTISLDKAHSHENYKSKNDEYYASYIAYDKAGKLRIYPIWLENDDIFIHEFGDVDKGLLSIKQYIVEHMSIPLGDNEEKILSNSLF